MNLSDFLNTWEGTKQENRVNRVIILLLSVSLIYLVMTASNRETTVVLVPPDLNEQVEVARNEASSNYLTSYGLFLATLLGNVTPANSEFLKQSLEPMLSARIHRPVMDALAEQINAIKLDRVTLSFEPKDVLYEPATNKVFVTGSAKSTGPSGKPEASTRTYEFRIRIDDYAPMLEHIQVYADQPRTQKVIEAEDARKQS